MNYQIEFDKKIIWKSSYNRNYKTKSSKNILCFPDHKIRGHISNKFCGRSIIVNTICPNENRVLIYGTFGPVDESENIYHIGDIVNEDKIKSKKSEHIFFIGKELIPYRKYEINSELKGWAMNARLGKNSPQYSFFAYIFININNKCKEYECVSYTKSPSFCIFSSRRNRTINKIIKLEYNRNKMNDKEYCESDNIFLDSLEKLKASTNPLSFKYKKLMPHIYDQDNSQSLEDDNKESAKQDPKNCRIYSMESMIESFKQFSISKPNTIFMVSADPFIFEIRIVERIDPRREELTYDGTTIPEAMEELNKGFEYLDKYGVIHRIKPSPDDIGLPMFE